jgi:hypothetical protein
MTVVASLSHDQSPFFLQPFFRCRKSVEGSFYLKQRISFLRHLCALGSNMRLLRISPVLL